MFYRSLLSLVSFTIALPTSLLFLPRNTRSFSSFSSPDTDNV